MTHKDMCDYGYLLWEDMMPITEKEAIRINEKYQVYVLYPDGTEEAICDDIKKYLDK